MNAATWVTTFGVAISLVANGADLTESTFIQVVNDVSVINPATKATTKAQLQQVVKAPQLVRTGPNSRAELQAQDQTLTRVGANTIFSFEPKGRNINLQQGSILFHSPTGKGGGTIKTGGASAAVLGTTLMIVATQDGGFKGIVLEGKGKFTLPNGSSRQLTAGQLLFVLPGTPGFGPTLNINLSKMVEGSGLVKGYTEELPSMPKVQAAVSKQDQQIASGKLQDTGILVGGKATKDEVAVIDSATFVAAVTENKRNIEKAWDRKLEVKAPLLPEEAIFNRDDPKYPQKSVGIDLINYAVLGENINITSQGVLLPENPNAGTDPTRFGIVAKEKLTVSGDVDFFSSANNTPDLVLAAAEMEFNKTPHIRYLQGPNLTLISRDGLKFVGGSVESGGDLTVTSTDKSIRSEATAFVAPKNLTLQADNDVKINGGTLAGNQIMVKAGAFDGSSKDRVLEVRGVNFRGPSNQGTPSLIRFEGTTLVFSDVNFSSQTPITMNSPYGLAPDPNSGKSVMNGYVNFIRNVTVDGGRAENYVLSSDHPYGNIVIGGTPPALAKVTANETRVPASRP